MLRMIGDDTIAGAGFYQISIIHMKFLDNLFASLCIQKLL